MAELPPIVQGTIVEGATLALGTAPTVHDGHAEAGPSDGYTAHQNKKARTQQSFAVMGVDPTNPDNDRWIRGRGVRGPGTLGAWYPQAQPGAKIGMVPRIQDPWFGTHLTSTQMGYGRDPIPVLAPVGDPVWEEPMPEGVALPTVLGLTPTQTGHTFGAGPTARPYGGTQTTVRMDNPTRPVGPHNNAVIYYGPVIDPTENPIGEPLGPSVDDLEMPSGWVDADSMVVAWDVYEGEDTPGYQSWNYVRDEEGVQRASDVYNHHSNCVLQ